MIDPEQVPIAPTPIPLEHLTDDERRGFLIACEMIQLWATQIAEKAPALDAPDTTIPLSMQMENSARFAVVLSQAMHRQAQNTSS